MSNILREHLADAILEGFDAVHDMDVTHDEYAWSAADAVIAALPDMVKPLEWIRGTARTSIATYIVAQMDNEPEDATVWFIYRNGKPLGVLGVFYDEKTAQISANAHHRAQILAAFGITQETAE